jgi:ribosomal-protein-alanine N-acetyltransferase
MPVVTLTPVRRSDASDLIQANIASREYHAPWVQTFTDAEGSEGWFGPTLTGAKVALVARSGEDGAVVGLFNFNEIVMSAFRSGYLGYFGMVGQARRGLMTEGLRRAAAYAFDEISACTGSRPTSSRTTPPRSPWCGVWASTRRGFRRAI